MVAAGRLRHRVVIQQASETQDSTTGAITTSWTTFATVWAAIEPLSARDFIAANAEQSKIKARIVIRAIDGVVPKMRIYHAAKDKTYDIVGVLADKDSGLDYLTLLCSEI